MKKKVIATTLKDFLNENQNNIEFDVIHFLTNQMVVDKKEYRGHIPTKYNKGSEWSDFSWIVDEISMFLNKKYSSSYLLKEFKNVYDYDIIENIIKDNYKSEYEYTLQHLLTESKKDSKSDLFYHGSSDINFDDFNKHEINYFTQNYDYAKKYISPVYSALRFNKSNANNGIFTVKLKCKNIFDTKNNSEHKKIFLDYTNNYGNQTPLTDSGYPDWSDVENLGEYFDEKKYKFDCIILQDAFEEISYATIGKNKVDIINKESF
jgi:hypothetical protein